MVMATGDDNATYAYTDPNTAAGNNDQKVELFTQCAAGLVIAPFAWLDPIPTAFYC